MDITIEHRTLGRMYTTDHVGRAAVLRASGHKVHEYRVSPAGRLVWVYPMTNPETGQSVHDTLRDYTNNCLQVDAKSLMDIWMEFRELTRSKEFVVGKT